jgi:hypothetical protein
MKQYRMLIQSVLIVVLGYMFLLLPHIVLAQEGSEGRSVDQEFVFVQGKARAISLENGTITVKPNKSKKIKIVIDAATTFKGASSLKDIEKANRVKVWYVLDGEDKKAVKIEKLPELGC